jgi:hypothetical protein
MIQLVLSAITTGCPSKVWFDADYQSDDDVYYHRPSAFRGEIAPATISAALDAFVDSIETVFSVRICKSCWSVQ